MGTFEKAIEILNNIPLHNYTCEESMVVYDCIKVLQDALDDEREAFEIHNSQGHSIDWNTKRDEGCDVEF